MMHYIAWAAAKTPAMRELYQEWIDTLVTTPEPPVEAPPPWLVAMRDRERLHRMEHDTYGLRVDVTANEVSTLRTQGWRFIITDTDFTELAHVQSHFFYERHFPRLRWMVLDAPAGEHFIIGDRPVVWEIAGRFDLTPAALRHPKARVFAPLTSSVALVGYASRDNVPATITVAEVNGVLASAAFDWIAGPTHHSVTQALALRDIGSRDGAI